MWLQTSRSNVITPILCPEDGISVLLRNVGNYQPARFQPRSNQNETLSRRRAIRPTPRNSLRTPYSLSADRGMNPCVIELRIALPCLQETATGSKRQSYSFHSVLYDVIYLRSFCYSFLPSSLKCFLS